ncbi:MAG: helicase HerA domain-containing protein [Candidatus Nanohaloarchaea archaeon]
MRTYFDAEGCMEDHEVTLSTASPDIMNRIGYMLLEFGIVPRFSERVKEATNSEHNGDKYCRIAISGKNQMQKFSEEIGFGIERKQEKLEKYLESVEGNTNVDVIPIEGEYLKKEREKVGLSQRELAEKIQSHSTLVSLYERNERRPSREKMSKMAGELDSEIYSKLGNSDLMWDKIESIERKNHQGYVYDITVRDHHNFIAGRGGIVSHNSYTVGVLIEEMLEHDFPVIVLDPHGEYSSLKRPNPESDESRGYNVKEYSPNTDINREALPLSFSSVNLDKKELTTLIPDSLTNSQMGVLYNALKRLKEKEDDYNLLDVQDAVSQEDSTAKWNLLNYLEQLEDSGLFSENPVDLQELVEPGRATIINLKAVEPEPTEMAAYMLAKKLFDLRKRNQIPPFIMVIEEAHNFTPEKGFGQAVSNPIMRKIASEGRKFGLGVGVISQRPARIDKNVLSQANTQFILRVTNPNDLKAISKSFEGVTSEIEDMIKSLPPGVAFLLGNDYPVMTDVRLRKSMHGGETQTSENYVEKENIKVFQASKSLQDVESMYNEKFSVAYYPLYLVENDSARILVDGVKGEVKAEKQKLSGLEEKVYSLVDQGMAKGAIVEELDISVAKAASIIESLEGKGLVKRGETRESILDADLDEEAVEKDSLIEFKVSEEEVSDEFTGEISRVRFPYYRSDETVYDPLLEKEI